ncbi:MAG: serine--tRNA ligase [Patescibacteria group bacterium]|nr:serine--tRNA ligase [Patescibacteria group bacterium]
MIDIKLLLKQPADYKIGARRRGLNLDDQIDQVVDLKTKLDGLIQKKDERRHQLKLESETKPSEETIVKLRRLKDEIKKDEAEIDLIEKEIEKLVELIPNPPSADTPIGASDKDNLILREVGRPPKFDFQPKDHFELGRSLDLIDTEKASEIAGSRFYYLKNEAVLLELALISFVFDFLVKTGFKPMLVPDMIKEKYYAGMGRLAGDQKEERYYLAKDELYLIGSAEHTLGPYHANEILEEKDLPKRYVGFSACFRREAGSYGKDVKGILRVHQFDKVEMFSFAAAVQSENEHRFLLGLQEKIVQALELPYRVVQICAGDIGFTDARAYDIETWLPGQNRYRETHSCSNTTDFQARGINVRVRGKDNKLEPAHLLNATGIALARTIIAILENYQTKEGWIRIPTVLRKYLGLEVIKR